MSDRDSLPDRDRDPDADGAPPIGGSWRNVYIVVLGTLAALIFGFSLVSRLYE